MTPHHIDIVHQRISFLHCSILLHYFSLISFHSLAYSTIH
uniref:Uncharacterized protein n=1 Tax=Parascaris equorum TaxID=6256 RepID=A0A914RM42_PAREQ